MEENYNKREIDNFHEGLKKELKGIREQLTIMNGSVKDNTRWRYVMIGGLSVVTAIVIPILLILITQWNSM